MEPAIYGCPDRHPPPELSFTVKHGRRQTFSVAQPSLDLAGIAPDLARVVEAWATLAPLVRAAV
jgi:hypothetical protein